MNFDAIEDLSWKEFREMYDEDPSDNSLAAACTGSGTNVTLAITCTNNRRCTKAGCANLPSFARVGFDCGTNGILYFAEKQECCGVSTGSVRSCSVRSSSR